MPPRTNPDYEYRPNRRFDYRPAVGRGTVQVECPFCGTITLCYVWSLAGSGKKCRCGAVHSMTDTRRQF